jgi:hypothetical protein
LTGTKILLFTGTGTEKKFLPGLGLEKILTGTKKVTLRIPIGLSSFGIKPT